MVNKCAWTECKNDATCSISNNLNKGRIDMCEECFNLYQKHCDAREKLSREEKSKKGYGRSYGY